MDINSLKTITVESTPVPSPSQHSAPAPSVPSHESSPVTISSSGADLADKYAKLVDSSVSTTGKPTSETLQAHVDKANSVMQAMDKGLEFVLDKRLQNEMVVKVVNKKTGDVIRQYPAEEVIKLMQRLDDAVGVLMDNKA